MRIKILFVVVTTIFLISSILISDTREIKETVFPTSNEALRLFLDTNYISGKYGPLTGIIVQKGNSVIFEKLPRVKLPQPVESITKSITSLVIGIAVNRGKIKDLDQKVLDFFPEYKNKAEKGWKFVTLRDLLTMHSGIEWDEDKRPEYLNPTYQMYNAKNMYEFILTRTSCSRKQFNYSSANAALLSQIIFKTTGKSFAQYAHEVLFMPLEISNYRWDNYKNGITNTSGGLYLTLNDLTKIGRLYLQNGKWNGKEIVSSEWVHDSFKSSGQVKGYLDVTSYGYMWWINDFYNIAKTGERVKICSACGFNNNHILLIPELDLSLTITGNSTLQSERYLNLLNDVLAQVSE